MVIPPLPGPRQRPIPLAAIRHSPEWHELSEWLRRQRNPAKGLVALLVEVALGEMANIAEGVHPALSVPCLTIVTIRRSPGFVSFTASRRTVQKLCFSSFFVIHEPSVLGRNNGRRMG